MVDGLSADGSLRVATCVLRDGEQYKTLEELNKARNKFRSLMAVDKKAANGAVRLILLKGPLGGCVFTKEFDPDALTATIEEYCAL